MPAFAQASGRFPAGLKPAAAVESGPVRDPAEQPAPAPQGPEDQAVARVLDVQGREGDHAALVDISGAEASAAAVPAESLTQEQRDRAAAEQIRGDNQPVHVDKPHYDYATIKYGDAQGFAGASDKMSTAAKQTTLGGKGFFAGIKDAAARFAKSTPGTVINYGGPQLESNKITVPVVEKPGGESAGPSTAGAVEAQGVAAAPEDAGAAVKPAAPAGEASVAVAAAEPGAPVAKSTGETTEHTESGANGVQAAAAPEVQAPTENAQNLIGGESFKPNPTEADWLAGIISANGKLEIPQEQRVANIQAIIDAAIAAQIPADKLIAQSDSLQTESPSVPADASTAESATEDVPTLTTIPLAEAKPPAEGTEGPQLEVVEDKDARIARLEQKIDALEKVVQKMIAEEQDPKKKANLLDMLALLGIGAIASVGGEAAKLPGAAA